jgi:hypothetical protein
MQMTDVIGYAASALVLATFCMRSMRTLRLLALASNIAFIAYAYEQSLAPVMLLHALLMPINIVRLLQLAGKPEDAEDKGVRDRHLAKAS